ncbi:hypothetical protein COCOBI_08-6070 [Coccomyxa sp. Obi]|nr:hypothetical protein COCOBI_08-6070 [Coccomyxa sp. Obi]
MLQFAAAELTGVRDADKFEDATEFYNFARDQNYGEVAGVIHRLWDLGFESCASISRVMSSFDTNIFAMLLNVPPENLADEYTLVRLRSFAHVHANMWDLEFVLSIGLPEPQRSTNEEAIREVFRNQIGCTINASIRHWKMQKWLQDEGKAFALWQSQGDTLTDMEWNRYASDNGIRYGLIFTHLWTWALVADGSNKLCISPGIRYDAMKPTVVDFITHKALEESGMCPRWETLHVHPRSTDAPDPSEGFAELDSNLPGTLQSGLTADPSGHAVNLSSEAIQLAQIAAALEPDWIKGVLGRGALGAVFEARLPCGRSVALKLAPPGSREGEMLRKEADVYMVLQELWNKNVPELLLAGPLHAFRSGYALGTCLLPGRRLQKGDEDLLPAALAILANIHAKGVIHGDLREDNFLVNEAGVAMGGTKTIVLIDFSHASLNPDKKAQDDEIDEMKDLFEYL